MFKISTNSITLQIKYDNSAKEFLDQSSDEDDDQKREYDEDQENDESGMGFDDKTITEKSDLANEIKD